jgi:hypothetical protein
MLRLRPVSLFFIKKALFELTLYLYYARKADSSGWEI